MSTKKLIYSRRGRLLSRRLKLFLYSVDDVFLEVCLTNLDVWIMFLLRYL